MAEAEQPTQPAQPATEQPAQTVPQIPQIPQVTQAPQAPQAQETAPAVSPAAEPAKETVKETAKEVAKEAAKAEKEKEKEKEPQKKPSGIKLFGKWDCDSIKVSDEGLREFINLKPMIVPFTSGRHTKKQFWKQRLHIVERLINKLLVSGHTSMGRKHMFTSGRNSGKKLMISKVVKGAFERIEEKTKSNPVQVYIKALENSAPKAETTSVEMGGVRRPVAVDVSPQRRIDLALSLISKGAVRKAIGSARTLEDCLAEELLLASNADLKSFSIEKKESIERQAESSR